MHLERSQETTPKSMSAGESSKFRGGRIKKGTDNCELRTENREPRTVLVLQRNHRAAIPAKRGHPLQVAIGPRHRHHRTVTEHGVPAGRKVPASALGMFRDVRRR